MKCMGGVIQGRLRPRDDAERRRALDAGHDLDRVLSTNDLVSGENVFFAATGITDGELLRGVHYRQATATTNSLVMRSKSGTTRRINSTHRLPAPGHSPAPVHGADTGLHPLNVTDLAVALWQ